MKLLAASSETIASLLGSPRRCEFLTQFWRFMGLNKNEHMEALVHRSVISIDQYLYIDTCTRVYTCFLSTSKSHVTMDGLLLAPRLLKGSPPQKIFQAAELFKSQDDKLCQDWDCNWIWLYPWHQ